MDSREKSQFPARQAASNYKQRKNQTYEVTVVNTEVTYKQVTSNPLENDGYSYLLRLISIPDGLEPWEDRTDICIPLIQHMIKLSETMPLIKPTNLWWMRFEDLPTSEAFFEVVKEAVEASRLTEWHLCRSTTELEPGALC
uniref:Uncharacterized protein n=1 Tax=Lactuca sativa TaxID=4236 RepID=A0A9R1UCF9_LACSA|nr:hypothetical protein LSAT_V11C900481350 [Lactuca sativa]